ncbi:antibiotic biosynthesis monooxygenase [Actinomadura sp. KC345]|uniref:antibiotic biosynthesis monooxygenase family protein n=1 Tax=Actinomadura sp. KC345 TaxID=2530371 RepID=UPI001052882A|nr:antibiotic biosynthesis monooxygenase family protein [Actinomadura sp. KC345]TDC45177.1 antibiotic biosynthesis monooxygenase [Actinomadura sp. KC345]
MSTDHVDAGTRGEVTFINRFTVHAAHEEFERIFAEVSQFMRDKDGFLGNTLFRNVDEPHIFINVARWRGAADFRRAVADPAFAAHAGALRAVSTSEPGLYAPCLSFSAVPAGGER